MLEKEARKQPSVSSHGQYFSMYQMLCMNTIYLAYLSMCSETALAILTLQKDMTMSGTKKFMEVLIRECNFWDGEHGMIGPH
jgi:hypothetical protein